MNFEISLVRGVFDEKPEFCYKSQKNGHRKKLFTSFFILISHYSYAFCMVVRHLVVGFGKLLKIDVLCDPIPT